MPELVGLRLAEVAKICSCLHLRLQILQTKEDDNLPDETVIQQIPAQGRMVKERQSIFIVLSQKRPARPCPSFIGLSQEELSAEGAKIGCAIEVHQVPYNYPTGCCFSQWPSPGQLLQDQPIVCYVAKRKEETVLCPNFIGLELQEALARCRELDMATRTDRPLRKGRQYVIDQNPKPGAILQESFIEKVIMEFKIAKKPLRS